MRVLVHEHLSGLDLADGSLRAEGQAMLTAVLADLAACPGVEAVTLAQPGLVEPLRAAAPGAEVHRAPAGGVEALFRRLARDAAFCLVIAPEFGDLLATRREWALEEGSRLLGPSPDVVRLCADKYRLGLHLREQAVPVPPARGYSPHGDPPFGYPCVVKPLSGAGAQQTYRIDSTPRFFEFAARTADTCAPRIMQPFQPGQPASVAVLAGPRQQFILPPAEQRIEIDPADGRMSYAGGAVHFPPLAVEAASLARRVLCAVPGLSGYFGIDLVLDGPDSVVIEINPRVTTSYVGLRRLARVNLMQLLLDVVRDRPVTPPTWHEGSVEFDADGTIH